MKESTYIKYRVIKGRLQSICFYLCRVFPIDRKLINVCTFEGKGGFGCNPRYIVEELHRRNPDYKFVWMVNKDVDKHFPDYVLKKNNTSIISRAYWLSRSAVWIDNYRKPLGTVKRKGQLYINVNHYTVGIKCTGLHRGDGFSKMAYIVSKNDSDMIDELVIDSKWCEECFDKALVYNGHMLKVGAPRCDVLYGNRYSYKIKFRNKHNLPTSSKVVMFAPTFREGSKDGKRFVYSQVWSLDFERLLSSLESRFGGEWYLCLRIHPQLAATFTEYCNSKIQDHIIDESQADDMYEILAAMDFYITDYSSAIFEAGFAKIPAVMYADDIDQYAKDRGQLMWDISTKSLSDIPNNKNVLPRIDVTFPFVVTTSNDELIRTIIDFDIEEYQKRMELFCNEIELTFDGKASQRLADFIDKELR